MWFERFIISTHKYMGDGVYQDKAITLVMVHKIMEGFKIKFNDRISDGEIESIVNVRVFVLASFLAELRGIETFKIVLEENRNYFEESQNNIQHKYVVLLLGGRFLFCFCLV